MRFGILGSFEVADDLGREVPLGGHRQRAVLAILLLHANEVVSSDRLIDELWGDRAPATAGKTIQVYISKLRRALGDGVVLTRAGGYVLDCDRADVDAGRFEALAADGRRALQTNEPRAAAQHLRDALRLWRGQPLADFAYERFAQGEVARLEEARLAAVEDRIEADLALGAHAALVGELEALVREHPLRERLHGQLMLALYRAGRQAEALEVYQRARVHLAEELGLEPSPALKAIQAQILNQDPALSRSAVSSTDIAEESSSDGPDSPANIAAAQRSRNRSHLPKPTSPLVGRGEEMSLALELLAAREVRLLTLWGPGGSGKTRLALEVAAVAAPRYREGARIVMLAPITDRALMVSELARVLEIAPVPGEPLERTLMSGLSGREVLLVLDNFEHLLAAAEIVAELLANAPRVDVLATSREPLRIRGEHRMDVPPLPSHDAAELFLARAKAVRPNLSIDEQDLAAVDRICARLDGLPLALELAAARVGVFAPRRLEARLAERLVLPEGPRDLPERQRTLRATIGWSYQLLEPAERSRLARLSPFIGGVRIDSAESIWGADAVERLISLAEKSLLRRREDPDGEPRLWMLETVREFVLERATSEGVAAAAAERHADHFRTLAEQAAPHLHGRAQRRWLDRLESDHANLRAALDHLAQYEPSRALRMATNLAWFWDHRGYHSEALSRLADLLELARSDDPARGPALVVTGRFRLKLGESELAKSLLLEALPTVREQCDQRSIALALAYLGWADTALGDDVGMAANYDQAIATARAAGDDWVLGLALNGYGASLQERGDAERALPLVMEALAVFRRIGDAVGATHSSLSAAQIALDTGDLELAESLNGEALDLARTIDFRPGVATALVERSVILLLRNEVEAAEADLHVGIKTSSLSDTDIGANAVAAAATVAAIHLDARRAAMLWAAADRRRSIPEPVSVARLRERWQPHARQAVDQADWDAATLAGADITLEDALTLAADADRTLRA